MPVRNTSSAAARECASSKHFPRAGMVAHKGAGLLQQRSIGKSSTAGEYAACEG